MFQMLGRFVSRAWAFVLLGWAILLVLGGVFGPPWKQYAQDEEFTFLPDDAPSRRAETVFQKAFPDDRRPSNVVLLLHGGDGSPAQLERGKKFIESVLEPGLRHIAEEEGGLATDPVVSEEPLFTEPKDQPPPTPERSIIARIQTPNAPGTGSLLISQDRKLLIVLVELTTDFLSNGNGPTIAKIERLIRDSADQAKDQADANISLTGSAVMGRDHIRAQLLGVQATESLTVALVIFLLIFIYRAPLLALIPLLTVAFSVQVSLNLLTFMAKAGYLPLFEGIQIYITILAYGAGVDYCLFLTARYKEMLAAGATDHRQAVANAVGNVGAALTGSAAAVICAIATMAFAEFGKFRAAGIAISVSIFVVLCATLTFSPAFLCLAGRWAFWPHRLRTPAEMEAAAAAPRSLWQRILHPGDTHRGWELLERILLHRPGLVWLLAVAVMAPFMVAGLLLQNHLSYDFIGNLPPKATSVAGTRVLQNHMPAGVVGPITMLLIQPQVDFRKPTGRALVAQLTEQIEQRKKDLGLATLRSLSAPLGTAKGPDLGPEASDIPEETRREAIDKAVIDYFTTDLGERARIGTRFDLILEQSPFLPESVDSLQRIENAVKELLPADLRDKTQLHFIGPTASVRDLQAVVQRDRTRIEILVLISVLLILLGLLRKVLISVYLLLSVVFSYYATLGVAFAVFWCLDPGHFTGIDWKVAIFLFTILVAVGEDYNIFLMTRIEQETKVHGPERGITVALVRTGPIISSCGIIMAGTFASLLAGSLAEMKQLGFALGFGVLLDTFVIRPILVPAFLIWFQRLRMSRAK